MKKIKFLILWLVLSIIWLTSFSSAWSVTFSWHVSYPITSSSMTTQSNVIPLNIPIPSSFSFLDYSTLSNYQVTDLISSITCEFSNLSSPNLSFTSFNMFQYIYIGSPSFVTTSFAFCESVFWEWTFTCDLPSRVYKWLPLYFQLMIRYARPNVAWDLSFDFNCSIEWDYIWWNSSSSCSSCESTLEALSGAFSTLSWYYSTCQSNLSSCQSWLSWYVECQSSLGACLEDNVSLENMNQSLSSELESCLESWWWGCNPEVDTGCVEGAIVPLLSWSVGLDSFTTPIINNLTLPTNYKWKIDDWVLTIASINSNLSIDDSDYWNIKSVFVGVVLFTFGLGLMLVLVYYLKFYFFNVKDKW